MIEQSKLEQNFQNKLRIDDLKIGEATGANRHRSPQLMQFRETTVLCYRDRKTMLLAQSGQEPPTYAIQRDCSVKLQR
jgi:hypothetical protein